jgi:hypothetical protein
MYTKQRSMTQYTYFLYVHHSLKHTKRIFATPSHTCRPPIETNCDDDLLERANYCVFVSTYVDANFIGLSQLLTLHPLLGCSLIREALIMPSSQSITARISHLTSENFPRLQDISL